MLTPLTLLHLQVVSATTAKSSIHSEGVRGLLRQLDTKQQKAAVVSKPEALDVASALKKRRRIQRTVTDGNTASTSNAATKPSTSVSNAHLE